MTNTHCPPEWSITGLVDKGPGVPFRFIVQGRTLNCQPGAYGYDFCWHVKDIADPRYAVASTAGPMVHAAVARAKASDCAGCDTMNPVPVPGVHTACAKAVA